MTEYVDCDHFSGEARDVYLSDRPRPKEEGDSGPGRRGRVGRTVVLLGFVSLFTDVSSEATAAVLPLYLTAVLGLTPLAFGFVDGLYQGATTLMRFFGGWLADRNDRPKPVAVVGYGLSAFARLALLVVSGLGGIVAVVSADRLGKGLRTAPRDALIAASTDSSSLGRAFGVHRALDTAGAAIGPLLAFLVLALLPGDYTAVFVVSFAAAVIGLALLVLMVPNLRPNRDVAVSRTPPPRPSLRLLLHGPFRKLAIAAGVLGLLTISDGFLYLTLQDRDDLAAQWFPLLFVGTNVVYLALAVPFGRLADRLGRIRVFLGGYGFLLVAYLCAAVPSGGAAATILCLVMLGSFYAATDGVLSAATASLVPAGLRGSAIGTVQSVVAAARLFSSLAFGWLWFDLGRETAMYVVALVLALVLPLAWWLLRGVNAVKAPAQ